MRRCSPVVNATRTAITTHPEYSICKLPPSISPSVHMCIRCTMMEPVSCGITASASNVEHEQHKVREISLNHINPYTFRATMNDLTQPFQLRTLYEVWDTADQDVAKWPPIRVSAACDEYLWHLGSLPPLSTTLGQVLGSLTVHQKTGYMERRSFLQHYRDSCNSWLRAINYSISVSNELSTSCQNVLEVIDGHLQELELWFQTVPDSDRIELESITQPQQQVHAQNRIDQLSPAHRQELELWLQTVPDSDHRA